LGHNAPKTNTTNAVFSELCPFQLESVGVSDTSYSGNAIASRRKYSSLWEFGPTRIDERHRIVLSGLFDLPHGFQLAPIVQFASARPYSPIAA